MNTRKTIYDKLFTEKVELAKHEVELALIDDLKKNNAAALKEYALYENNRKKARLAIAECKTSIRQYAVILNKNINLINETKVKAKELGLALPADVLAIEKSSVSSTNAFKTIQPNLIQAEKLL